MTLHDHLVTLWPKALDPTPREHGPATGRKACGFPEKDGLERVCRDIKECIGAGVYCLDCQKSKMETRKGPEKATGLWREGFMGCLVSLARCTVRQKGTSSCPTRIKG